MRQWLVNPKILCRKHLLGEHVEIHMFIGVLKLGHKINNYIKNNLIETGSLKRRHEELVEEMLNRGWNHKSNLIFDDRLLNYLPSEFLNYKIDKQKSLDDLIGRCEICRSNYEKI